MFLDENDRMSQVMDVTIESRTPGGENEYKMNLVVAKVGSTPSACRS